MVMFTYEIASSRHFLSGNDLCRFLKERCDRDTGYGIINKLVLPSWKSCVRMVTYDARNIIQSLLTCTENKGKECLVCDHNPFK